MTHRSTTTMVDIYMDNNCDSNGRTGILRYTLKDNNDWVFTEDHNCGSRFSRHCGLFLWLSSQKFRVWFPGLLAALISDRSNVQIRYSSVILKNPQTYPHQLWSLARTRFVLRFIGSITLWEQFPSETGSQMPLKWVLIFKFHFRSKTTLLNLWYSITCIEHSLDSGYFHYNTSIVVHSGFCWN